MCLANCQVYHRLPCSHTKKKRRYSSYYSLDLLLCSSFCCQFSLLYSLPSSFICILISFFFLFFFHIFLVYLPSSISRSFSLLLFFYLSLPSSSLPLSSSISLFISLGHDCRCSFFFVGKFFLFFSPLMSFWQQTFFFFFSLSVFLSLFPLSFLFISIFFKYPSSSHIIFYYILCI